MVTSEATEAHLLVWLRRCQLGGTQSERITAIADSRGAMFRQSKARTRSMTGGGSIARRRASLQPRE